MPPAIWPILIISLIVVLSSSTSSLRTNVIMAVVAPTVVTLFVWLLNMFFADDYAMGRRAVLGVAFVFVPSLLACFVAALVMTFLKRRSTRDLRYAAPSGANYIEGLYPYFAVGVLTACTILAAW